MDLTSPLPFRHQREPHMPKPLEIPVVALPLSLESSPMEAYPRSNSLPSLTPPPRSPLPPHKLAKIANALGVSTPMPAFYRARSESGSSSMRTPSRYLLHIVPPAFLPSDEDDYGPDPEGASSVSASGYRSQFRRGTLIPLYPTLQSQLGAIAREYSLPSTGGLVLYLVLSSQDGALDGPRISDDTWKLLWHKALQAERQDLQPRTPSTLNLRSGRSTPSSPFHAQSRELPQGFTPTSRMASSHFPYPSPSTSSTPSSEIYLPLSEKDESDFASIASDFTPNPFLPILAKVEFDIDRRKAPWYNSWVHGKRERSRWRTAKADGNKLPLELPERTRSQSRNRFQNDVSLPNENNEYAMLEDGDGDGEGDNTAVDEDEQEEATVTMMRNQDPLADVFGNDAETWNEMHAGRQRKATTGLSTIAPDLIIPPGDKDADEESDKVRDEDEIVKLWDANQRPTLSLNSPPPPQTTPPRKGAPPPLNIVAAPLASPALGTGKSVLPYLNNGSPSDSGSSTSETFEKRMKRRTGIVFPETEVRIVAEPEQMSEGESHRYSQVVMKHKLDQLEKQLAHLSPRQLSVSPPPIVENGTSEHGQGKGWQLRSAPPGVDRFNLAPPTNIKTSRSFNASSHRLDSLDASTPPARPVDDPFTAFSAGKDSLVGLQSRAPGSHEHKRAKSSQSSSSSSFRSHLEQPQSATTWPAVTPASVPNTSSASSPASKSNVRKPDRSAPQLTINRASGGQRRHSPSPTNISEETKARAADEGQDVMFPAPRLPTVPGSPLIPLSPDPFGKRPVEDLRPTRYSNESAMSMSTESQLSTWTQGTVLPASVPEHSELSTQSSRFSADSEKGLEEISKQRRSRSGSVMSVRGFRNLWRKSTMPGKPGVMPPSPSPSELVPSLPSTRPSSQHSREESTTSQRSVRLPAERMRRPSAAPRPDSGSDPFQFDNANIYKSASSSSLTSPVTSGTNYASIAGSVGQSKGILKGWTGNANPSEADIRRTHRPSPKRSTSTASASLSDSGERSADSHSSPPSSPPDIRRASVRRKQTPSPSLDPALISHSLPNSTAIGLSRYPEAVPSATSSSGSTPRLSDFEIISPPKHSSSYTGEVY
ncbi:hypothetical protein K439DRAFT_1663571 [Ramaria rubella]|nr:hypothetical protein K439DRAFT_1663571 [Ramaria rubella]